MSTVTPLHPELNISPPETALLDQLASDPVYAEYQSLLALEARSILCLADCLYDDRLGPRLRGDDELGFPEHEDFPSIMNFAKWLDVARGEVKQIGRSSTPTSQGIAIKRVQVEAPMLRFCELVTQLAGGVESPVMQRVHHLYAAILIGQRQAEPGSAYATALHAARQAAAGATGRGPRA